MKWTLLFVWASVSLACSPSTTKVLGQVQDCDNGTYFSLQERNCLPLWGYQPRLDEDGFARLQVFNGLTVPSKINGRSPFTVEIAYDVAKTSQFEVMMKRVDQGQVGSETFSDYQKFSVPPGRGVKTLIVHSNQDIPEDFAATYIQGRWNHDSGYILEVKGGDRFEDEDDDGYGSWRVAGLQVDRRVKDDLTAKTMILEAIAAPLVISSCSTFVVDLPVQKLSFPANFEISLKQPGKGWVGWGSAKLDVEAGFSGKLSFTLTARNNENLCAPTGPSTDPDSEGRISEDGYQLQLDIIDKSVKPSKKLEDLKFWDFQVAQGFLPVSVTSSALSSE